MSEGRNIRLATFAPGSVFGELALLDRGPRSATVTADDEVTPWALSGRTFDTLRREEPDLAIQSLAAPGASSAAGCGRPTGPSTSSKAKAGD